MFSCSAATTLLSIQTRKFLLCYTIHFRFLILSSLLLIGQQHSSRTVEMYDPGRDSWRRVNRMQSARDSFVGAVLGQSLVVIGGFNGLGSLESVEQCPLDRLILPQLVNNSQSGTAAQPNQSSPSPSSNLPTPPTTTPPFTPVLEGSFEHVLELELEQSFTSAGYAIGRSLPHPQYFTYYGQRWAFGKKNKKKI